MAAATHFSYDVRPSALRLCALHPGLTADLHQLVASGLSETEVQDARQDILEGLSRLLLEPEATCHVARHCRPILLGLCHRLLAQQRAQGWSLESHEAVSLAFARLLPVAPHVRACALEYFTDVAPFPPFERLNRSAACASEPLEVRPRLGWLLGSCSDRDLLEPFPRSPLPSSSRPLLLPASLLRRAVRSLTTPHRHPRDCRTWPFPPTGSPSAARP